MASTTDIIHSWYQDVWINGHWESAGKIYKPAPDRDCLVPGGTAPPEEAREIVTALNALVTDQKLRIIHTVEQDQWITAFVEFSGIKAGTATRIQFRWSTLFRITGGYIVENYPCANFVTFFEQLEQLPSHSFELLLAGTVLR